MLDYFAIFTRGGALLWTLQFTTLRHNPLEAINALVRDCLLEERSSDAAFTYAPKAGAAQTLKWTFHNGLNLVFVAVYQKSLSLMYVDELLSVVKDAFLSQYNSGDVDHSNFKQTFDKLLSDCEARADKIKRGDLLSKRPPASERASSTAATPARQAPVMPTPRGKDSSKNVANPESGDEGGLAKDKPAILPLDGASGSPAGDSDDADAGAGAFNVSKLKGALSRGARGRQPPPAKKKEGTPPAAETRKKENRNWGALGGSRRGGTVSAEELDRSDMAHCDEAVNSPALAVGGEVSRMDADDAEDNVDDFDEEQLGKSAVAAATSGNAASSGVLGSFLGRLALRVTGSSSLTEEDLAPALDDMKKRLMERNVAEGIAAAVCASVGESLKGQKLASFTGVGALARKAFEEALSGILLKRQVDVLLDIKKAQERGKPYVVVFCGVNGVGKSTNLAKIAYWLGQHGIKVTIAACDTFRAGAVEQLKTHCTRLQVPLYERGYEKDPAKVAFEAVKQAERDGRDVVLVDTAGRMQDNEPLMRALSNLISVNEPNLVLFVGEALVGNDAVDQLTKFNRALLDLSPAAGQGSSRRRGIDGIVLTKFDTIDDKVGAAVSMVYSSGAPVMFVGCGQTYVDLKKLNVKSVVKSLLK
mmetsp:Transcript_10210/g.30822  ORF Transcript_10210/g.30822 Transcript_10210/m.30822 type:complete len:646 (-) Transcript_10210:82-2019(-)